MFASDDTPARQGVIDRIREAFDRLFGRPTHGRPAASAATGGVGGRPAGSPPRDDPRGRLGWGLGAA